GIRQDAHLIITLSARGYIQLCIHFSACSRTIELYIIVSAQGTLSTNVNWNLTSFAVNSKLIAWDGPHAKRLQDGKWNSIYAGTSNLKFKVELVIVDPFIA